MNEQEARIFLNNSKVEIDPSDPRSTIEVARDLGCVSMQSDKEEIIKERDPMNKTTDTVSINKRSRESRPYFVRQL